MKARSTMLVMVVFAIAGISPAAAQTVYVERYETLCQSEFTLARTDDEVRREMA